MFTASGKGLRAVELGTSEHIFEGLELGVGFRV